MKYTYLILTLFCSSTVFCQDRVGINIDDPKAILDIRGTDNDFSGGEIKLGTPNGEHFMRFFGGRNLDRNPFLLFSALDTFRISTSFQDFSKFENLLRINPDGRTAIGNHPPLQKLDVQGKLKISDDAQSPDEGTMRYNQGKETFEGYTSSGWMIMNNNLYYQDKSLFSGLGTTVRNSEADWGETITIPETGKYTLAVSAYFSSSIFNTHQSGTSFPQDSRGRLKIYINDELYKLLECGNGMIDRDDGFVYVSFAPGTRSMKVILDLEAGDEIRLTKAMQTFPITTTSVSDLWIAYLDEFYIERIE